MSKAEMMDWIAGASYYNLLAKWRFMKAGAPWFVGEVGEYYAKEMARKRDLDPAAAVAASKTLGW